MNARDRAATVADENSSFPTDVPCAVHFDDVQQAWIISRYADVTAALRDARVVLQGAGDLSAHQWLRSAAVDAFSPDRLEVWRDALTTTAHRFAQSLPHGEPVDLVSAFARPWCLGFAALATGLPEHQMDDCAALARTVFMAAAAATSGAACQTAIAASSELSRLLTTKQVAGRASADVQSFVALSQTLPGLLAGSWLALAHHPHAAARLRASPELMPAAVGELLRLASPSRAVFREASAELVLEEATIQAGDRIILLLSAANRDPLHFSRPHELDLARPPTSHLGFGAGAHYCAGTMAVRLAVEIATHAFLAAADDLQVSHDVAWIGGYAIRAPGTLPMILSRNPLPGNALTYM